MKGITGVASVATAARAMGNVTYCNTLDPITTLYYGNVSKQIIDGLN